ncbi:keratin, type I cytoskeletal 19 [Hypomesus transpacificus]|uniref:keratin, type I cytoskeletal 19 n=1 Tax=Hypomesus transpacificus TaxID=137520 RepID=UPI001F076B60|nr:keratin, type I cytoskeletal 19 [Hypomesus transpacificus]
MLPERVSMELLDNSGSTMQGLNVRLKGFLEQVNRLEVSNQRLESQIVDWSNKNVPQPRDLSKQERTINDLRAQIAKLLMENSQLVLQSDNMKSRAAQIQARCEMEERQTKRLEQQVGQLRETKRRAELGNITLEAELRSSMSELQQTQKDFAEAETARSLQQRQQAESCDVLLVTDTAGGEEDGTGMELSQLLDRISTQRDRLSQGDVHPSLDAPSNPGPGFAGLSRARAAASTSASAALANGVLAQEEAAWAQVNLGGAALKEARAELAEARKQWHSLQVEIETLHALEKGLESSLHHTQRQYSTQLHDLSRTVAGLEGELHEVRGGLVTQRERHSQLLNTKMRLEREIATYRRLLEREEGRYLGRNGQVMTLQPWRGSLGEPKENGLENGFSDLAVTPDEPKSEPLPDIPSLLTENGMKGHAVLRRQQSLVILTDPETDNELKIATVKTQEILQGKVVRESAECHGTVETEKIDKVIKQWEGSFFQGNPKLRKKSVSLRFDLHMAAADEGCAQTKQDSLPDVEVRLVMKRSRSIPTITQ